MLSERSERRNVVRKHETPKSLTAACRRERPSRDETEIEGKRLVLLTIPAAKSVPTKFSEQTFIRIGSSKEKLSKFPERAKVLFDRNEQAAKARFEHLQRLIELYK